MAIIKNPVTVVQSGSTPVGPPDPAIVYANNRPSTWLQMPSDANVADDEMYYLLEIGAHRTTDVIFGVHHQLTTNGAKYDVDFGHVENGAFVADSSYYVHDVVSPTKTAVSIPASMFIQTGDTKQIIMRTKPQSSTMKVINSLYSGDKFILEIKGKATNADTLSISSSTASSELVPTRMRYFSLLGANKITSFKNAFANCRSLEAIVALQTPLASTFENAFTYCSDLAAFPAITAPNATICTAMFNYCEGLEYPPDINVPSATGLNSMFTYCYNLKESPQNFVTTSVTNFGNMFYNCYSLEKVYLFDTSSGTTFENMFYGCYALKELPLFDTSNVASFKQMCYNCYSLHTVPLLDTSSGADFTSMFNTCYELENVPAFDILSATTLASMFANCYSLKSAPALDTSSVTNLGSMFFNCYSLEELPAYDTSSCTVFKNMFGGCNGLEYIDLSSYDFSQVAVSSDADNFMGNCILLGGGNILCPSKDKFPAAGVPAAASAGNGMFSMSKGSSDSTAYNAVNFLITDENDMLPLQGSAKNVFGGSTNSAITVYVPDSLYATYTADSNWSQLGTRLKKMSDLPS